MALLGISPTGVLAYTPVELILALEAVQERRKVDREFMTHLIVQAVAALPLAAFTRR